MNSKELNNYNFRDLQSFTDDYIHNKELVLKLPKKKGVYVIVCNKPICRVKGKSDIVYIGQGTIQYRIQSLFRNKLPINYRNYSSNHTAMETLKRIVSELKLKIKFSFIVTNNKEKCKNLESDLILQYCRDHIEPPPLNNTRT
jgi:hypothetical protein